MTVCLFRTQIPLPSRKTDCIFKIIFQHSTIMSISYAYIYIFFFFTYMLSTQCALLYYYSSCGKYLHVDRHGTLIMFFLVRRQFSHFIALSPNKIGASTIVLGYTEVSSQRYLKLLGIILDPKLNYKSYIDTMAFKTYHHQSFYSLRKIRIFLNTEDAKSIYCSMTQLRQEYLTTLFYVY